NKNGTNRILLPSVPNIVEPVIQVAVLGGRGPQVSVRNNQRLLFACFGGKQFFVVRLWILP
ncbi:hypothetical protein, partial [Limosilactobacillus ingluviei]|uniref:hypothetical protein n=1 Tax=Limosilactobacillus ingluviei TaxID=148604 RepID=UPI001F4340F2